MSCSRTQHRAAGEDRSRDLGIKESDALPTELSVLLMTKSKSTMYMITKLGSWKKEKCFIPEVNEPRHEKTCFLHM